MQYFEQVTHLASAASSLFFSSVLLQACSDRGDPAAPRTNGVLKITSQISLSPLGTGCTSFTFVDTTCPMSCCIISSPEIQSPTFWEWKTSTAALHRETWESFWRGKHCGFPATLPYYKGTGCVLTDPLLIQFPAEAPGKLMTSHLHPHRRLLFSLTHVRPLWPLGEWANRCKFSLSPTLPFESIFFVKKKKKFLENKSFFGVKIWCKNLKCMHMKVHGKCIFYFKKIRLHSRYSCHLQSCPGTRWYQQCWTRSCSAFSDTGE